MNMNNKKGLKKVACTLSTALMLSGFMGVASTVTGNTDNAVVAEAATKKTEAQLRKLVLGKYPGTVQRVYKEWDDGRLEYNYRIKQNNGRIVEVQITEHGYITDVDFEGYYNNGHYYDDDYNDDDYNDDDNDDDYYDWD